jgi:RNA polymerase sigma-70 factor (ECF subfamily)
MDDRGLLQACADGDRTGCAAFVERHLPAIWRYARLLTGDDTTAEDVLQDTLLAALQAAGSFAGEGSARAWLYTIARHSLARRHRRRAGEPARFHDSDAIDVLGPAAGFGADAADAEAALEAAEDRERVRAALARLSPADQEVLVLRDIEGLDGDETSAVLGLPLAAMKTRLHRARLRLAAELREGCHAG